MFKKSTVFILHFAPSLRFTLSLQSAFHPRSAVCSLQSAVCSLRITLTGNRFSITAKESLLGQVSQELLLLLFTRSNIFVRCIKEVKLI